MAISGWFHIPQIGEDGYVEGAEEKLVKNSGLMQLQGNLDQYDAPNARPVPVPVERKPPQSSSQEFDEADLEFLLKYMAPTYLTPDTLEQITEHFENGSSITLPNLLGKKFARRLREYVAAQEKESVPESTAEIEKKGPWRVARPPHKHRYLYQQPSSSSSSSSGKNGKSRAAAATAGAEDDKKSPIKELLDEFLPSPQFRRWLQIATGCVVESHDLVARRFRRGLDYTLATGHEGKPRLELNLGITPTTGWGDDGDEEEDEEEEEDDTSSKTNGKSKEKKSKKNSSSSSKEEDDNNNNNKSKGKNKGKGRGKAATKKEEEEVVEEEEEEDEDEEIDVGGHEVYMAGDEDAANEDAAVYKSGGGGGGGGGGGDEGDNILFFQAAAWNKLTIVLRDSGALKFVKYVSRSARGDRWDVSGTFEVEEQDDDDDDDDDDDENENENGVTNGDAEVEIDAEANARLLEEDTEEEWNGFPSSSDSESD